MAVQQGTATNYRDLLDLLRTFLTTGLGAQNWTQLRWTTTATTQELIMKAPGLGGIDNIYVGINSFENIPSDYFNWQIAGFTGYLPLQPFTSQPLYDNSYTSTLNAWNSTIPYTFIANGRRCIVRVRINTRYYTVHFGLLTPYATAAQYPYPMCIWGNSSGVKNSRWSAVAGSGSFNIISATGSWVTASDTFPVINGGSELIPAVSGEYFLAQMQLMANPGFDTTNNRYLARYYGDVDGLFVVPGQSNVSDNIVTYSGVDHLVTQDGSNTSLTSYIAVRLS